MYLAERSECEWNDIGMNADRQGLKKIYGREYKVVGEHGKMVKGRKSMYE